MRLSNNFCSSWFSRKVGGTTAFLVGLVLLMPCALGQAPGGGGGIPGGGSGGGENVDKFDLISVTCDSSSTLVTITYQMSSDYVLDASGYLPKITSGTFGIVETEAYEFDIANDLSQGTHSVQVDVKAMSGTFFFDALMDPGPAEWIGKHYVFFRDNATITLEPYILMIARSPMPNMPAEPHCGTCESSVSLPRGAGIACPSVALDGIFGIQLFNGAGASVCGSDAGGPAADNPGMGQPVGAGPDGICLATSCPTCPAPGGVGIRQLAGDGCNTCAGGGSGGSFAPNMLVSMLRAHLQNAWYPSSFGPGIFSAYDHSAYIQNQEDYGVVMRVYDAALGHAVTMRDIMDPNSSETSDGVLNDEFTYYKRAEYLSSGVVTTSFSAADAIRVVRHDGSSFTFTITDTTGHESSGTDLDSEGVLSAITDRNGNATTISAITNGIRTITDRYGYSMTFTYGATVRNEPAVSSVTFPNGEVATVTYQNDFLSQVLMPEGLKWTCSLTNDPAAQTTSLTVSSPVTCTRVYKITQDFMEYDGNIISQPANVLRGCFDISGNNLLSIYHDPNDANEMRILRAADQLIQMRRGESMIFCKQWAIDDPNNGYGAFVDPSNPALPPVYEGEYASNNFINDPAPTGQTPDTEANFMCGAPSTVTTDFGDSITITYDDDSFVSMREYADGTYEAWTVNGFKQITRFRDRLGNVTKMEYDANGNLLKRMVGIVDTGTKSAPVDVNQPEYAEYKWEYNSAGDVTAIISPLNTGELDIYRTDLIYMSNGKLEQVLESADVVGGPRATTVYSYNSAGQVETILSPLANQQLADQVTYGYDLAGRLVKTTYNDATTDEIIYHATASNPGLEGYVQKTKDRVDVYTTREYDTMERVSKNTVATEVKIGTTVTLITDPAEQQVVAVTYMPFTTVLQSQVIDGRKVSYGRDFRRRVVDTTRYPQTGKTLVNKTIYKKNRVFYTEDPYGRKIYMAYSASNSPELIRRVQTTRPGFTLNDGSAVLVLNRSQNPNSDYVIFDAIKDAAGNLHQVVNGRNTMTEYEYDSRNRQTKRTEAIGTSIAAITETDYDVANNVATIRTPRYFAGGPQAAYMVSKQTYTGRGLSKKHTTAVGSSVEESTSLTYFLDGRIHTATNPAGQTSTMDYKVECCGQFTGRVDELGHGTMTNTNAVGAVVHNAFVENYSTHTAILNPVDATTWQESTSQFDYLRRKTASTNWLVARGGVDKLNPPIAGLGGLSSIDGLTTQTYYDSNLSDGFGFDSVTGMPISKLGGGSYYLSLSDVLAKLAESPATGGASVSFSPDESAGSAVVSINAEEEIDVLISDGVGRLVVKAQLYSHSASTTPLAIASHTCTEFDNLHSINGFGVVVETRSIDALGNVTCSRNDGAGRTLESVDASGFISTAKHNASGEVVEWRSPNQVGIDAVFDALGRNTSRTDTWGNTISVSYDVVGNAMSQTDAKGKLLTSGFDAQNRRSTVTDRLGGVTSYDYTSGGLLSSTMDQEGNVTSYEYDVRGQRTKVTDPDNGIIQTTFDPSGKPERRTDQSGNTVTFNFDLSGRLISRDYRTAANSPTGPIADSDTFTRDKMNRLLTAYSSRYDNTVTRTYDEVGRWESENLNIDNQDYVVSQEYNNLNQPVSMVYPDGSVVERTYTNRGQLFQTKYAGDIIDTRTYDDSSRLSTSVFANGVVTTLNYRDDLGYKRDNMIDSIVTTNPGAEKIGVYNYAYDANKNKTGETITNGGVANDYGFSTGAAGYDDNNRLVAWNRLDNNLSQSWDLSLVGDWNFSTENGIMSVRTYNSVHEVETIGGAPLAHDANGNLTTDSDGKIFTYDFDNRMTSADIDGGGADITYEYDAIGRRVKVDDTVFAMADRRVVAEYDAGGAASLPNELYVYGSYLDEPILKDGTGGKVYYSRNQQYSITALTDSAGQVVERYAYDAYGELTILDANGTSLPTSVCNNSITFTGRRYDRETNLYYFRARYYSPKNGAFLSRDPTGFVDGMSLYLAYFVPNSIDPLGLCADRCRWERHHWFSQEYRPEISRLCPDFDMDLFVTPLLSCTGKYLPCDAHGYLHHRRSPKWNPMVGDTLRNSKTCCDFLIAMQAHILTAYAELLQKFDVPCRRNKNRPLYDETFWTENYHPRDVVYGSEITRGVIHTTHLFENMIRRCKENNDYQPNHNGRIHPNADGSLGRDYTVDAIVGSAGAKVGLSIMAVIKRLMFRRPANPAGCPCPTIPYQRQGTVPPVRIPKAA